MINLFLFLKFLLLLLVFPPGAVEGLLSPLLRAAPPTPRTVAKVGGRYPAVYNPREHCATLTSYMSGGTMPQAIKPDASFFRYVSESETGV